MRKIFAALVLGAVLYAGYSLGSPYVKSFRLKGEMQSLVDKAHLKSDREILAELLAYVKENDLPVTRKDVRIRRHDGRTSLSLSYKQVVEIPFYSREYRFSIQVTS